MLGLNVEFFKRALKKQPHTNILHCGKLHEHARVKLKRDTIYLLTFIYTAVPRPIAKGVFLW